MLIYFVKFFHLIFALGLLGLTAACLFQANRNSASLLRLNNMIFLFAFIAALTGTFLVYPKHFTFHTPWIQAAYLLVLLFCAGIFLISVLKKTFSQRLIWVTRLLYVPLIFILLLIMHDAVTKTTLLF